MARSENYRVAYEDYGYYEDPLEQAIRDYVATNPSPAELAAAMSQYGVSAEQISQATGYTPAEVNNYIAPAEEIDYAAQQREDVYTPVAPPPPEPPPVQNYTSYETESGTVYEPVYTPPTPPAPVKSEPVQQAQTSASAPTQAVSDSQADALVREAYASIGRTGVGNDVSQIDPAGYENFANLLKTGAVKPEDFATVFQGAADRYMADRPDDPYTQYVNQYRSGTATPPPPPRHTRGRVHSHCHPPRCHHHCYSSPPLSRRCSNF
jgi:hypothetical protein